MFYADRGFVNGSTDGNYPVILSLVTEHDPGSIPRLLSVHPVFRHSFNIALADHACSRTVVSLLDLYHTCSLTRFTCMFILLVLVRKI